MVEMPNHQLPEDQKDVNAKEEGGLSLDGPATKADSNNQRILT